MTAPRPSIVLSLASFALACASACVSSTPASPAGPAAASSPAAEQPSGAAPSAAGSQHFVSGPGVGPAIFLNAEPNSPAIGYVSPGVEIEVYGAEEGGRVPVKIRGGMKVRAWMRADRLALRVQRRGRVRDTPTYVGPNDLLRVLGPDSDPARLRVEVRPLLGRTDEAPLGPFVGSYPRVGLALDRVVATPDMEPEPGVVHRLPAGQSVPIYDAPGGSVVATLPALDPPLNVVVLRDQAPWKGIRAGVGPYVIGWIDVPTVPVAGAQVRSLASGTIPLRLQADPDRPLFRLGPGTRIRFEGVTVAVLDRAGFAREMHRYDETGEADVFVAVDDELAVRGIVQIGDLQPL